MSIFSLAYCIFFFFNDTATTEIYTLSLHDALPIWAPPGGIDSWKHHLLPALTLSLGPLALLARYTRAATLEVVGTDRKSTRLNSSHANISYAVFCLKKKKKYSNS